MLGERWAAVEVYPPQHLVVDVANLYHLWCTSEKLRVGWDDGGEYTVRHTFYVPRGDEEDHGLPEIVAARSFEDNQKLIQGMLEGNDSDAILRDLRTTLGQSQYPETYSQGVRP